LKRNYYVIAVIDIYFRTFINDCPPDDDDTYSIEKEVVTEAFKNSYEELALVMGDDDRASAAPINSLGKKKRYSLVLYIFIPTYSYLDDLIVFRFSIFGGTRDMNALKAISEAGSVSAPGHLPSLPAPLASLIGTCRPVLFPSPSGKFCVIHWKQSGFYMVISLNFKEKEVFSSSGSKCLKNGIFDRGICLSIGWASASTEEECYALVVPSGKPQINRRKSMFSWSSSGTTAFPLHYFSL